MFNVTHLNFKILKKMLRKMLKKCFALKVYNKINLKIQSFYM